MSDPRFPLLSDANAALLIRELGAPAEFEVADDGGANIHRFREHILNQVLDAARADYPIRLPNGAATEVHNALAPEILKRIVREAGATTQALVVVESVVLGAVYYIAQRDARKAAEYLEQMAQAVTERLSQFGAS